MDPAADQIESILADAVELGSETERRQFVARATAGDAELQRRVEQLIADHFRAGSFLEEPAAFVHRAETEFTAEAPGSVIGLYRLLEQIGEGGFGVVFMAEQREPIERKVAVKVLKPGMDTRQVVARFEAERQALAMMDHPNIARVLDAGETATGRPYFVMELVRGIAITQFCDSERLTPRGRLELFISVCQAVQHAHQKGIIHRDLKPSNVLVTLHDGTPAVKVIDFGIAKAMGQRLTNKTLFTGFAHMIGTPLYMSPEQAAHSALDVDTRSDIYSLGVLLYELLTGTTPFDRERFQQAAFDEICRILREEEPPKPSTRISTLGKAADTVCSQRKCDPQQLSRLFRGELDWILMKCLEKDRNRRYETASGLARDLEHYLQDEPVQACPPSAGYRLRKFVRRNRGALITAAIIGLTLLVAISSIMGSVGWIVRDREAQRSKLENAVHLALGETANYLEASQWPEALTSARRAEDLVRSGAAQQRVHEDVRQMLAEVAMAARLEAVRLQPPQVRGGRFDRAATLLVYSKAFADYGLPLDSLDPDEAARRIAASPIRDQLMAALDNWAFLRQASDAAGSERLVAIVGRLDQDPWRGRFRDAQLRADRAALEQLAASREVAGLSASTLDLLGAALDRAGANSAALALMQEAQLRHPADFWINYDLACYLLKAKPPQPQRAVEFFRAALALRPQSAGVHVALGCALADSHQLEEAIRQYHTASNLDPHDAWPHVNLGNALREKNDLNGAIHEYQAAIDLEPRLAMAHNNLGTSLRAKVQLEEAIREYRRAIDLDPQMAMAHWNLGLALRDMHQLEEAILEHRAAVHLEPDSVLYHLHLGDALSEKGLFDEAIEEFRAAIRLDAESAVVHYNLGNALRAKKQLAEAVSAYRAAIRSQPDFAEAHCNLGLVLRDQGALVEARIELREGHRLGSQRPGWSYPSATWLREVERLIEREPRK